jgi:hypothetical protein
VARFNDIWAEFDAHELANMVGAKAWLEYAGLTPQYPSMEKHGKVFEFKNSETGQPLANRLFIVNDNGNTLKSKTDSSGRAIIEAPAGNSISIHLVFESPQGVLKYGK